MPLGRHEPARPLPQKHGQVHCSGYDQGHCHASRADRTVSTLCNTPCSALSVLKMLHVRWIRIPLMITYSLGWAGLQVLLLQQAT